MAESNVTTIVSESVTPEAFLADRQHFWSSFTHFTIASVAVVVIGLILMRIFLL